MQVHGGMPDGGGVAGGVLCEDLAECQYCLDSLPATVVPDEFLA